MYTIHKISFLKFYIAFAFAAAICTAKAQTTNHFSVTADVVSSYVWRGVAQENSRGGSPNIQPTISYSIGVFNIGAWSSYSFSGNVKEVDLFATLLLPHAFSVTITDYNWNNGNDNNTGYFNYINTKTGHVFEGTIAYAGTQSFPLSITWNTMVYGADKKVNENQAFSTYVELGWPVNQHIRTFLGASLFDSPNYYNSRFSVINLGLRVAKDIKLSGSFTFPVYGIIGANPQAGKVFCVVGLTL